MGYCHRDRKQRYVYVDDCESDMLKRDGNALQTIIYTKGITCRNYLHSQVEKKNYVADSEKKSLLICRKCTLYLSFITMKTKHIVKWVCA